MGFNEFWNVKDNINHGNGHRSNSIQIGIVVSYVEKKDKIPGYYVVQTRNGLDYSDVICVANVSRFGGYLNYEHYSLDHCYAEENTPYWKLEDKYKPGDRVLIAYINGYAYEGVILGSILNEEVEKEIQKKKDEYAYFSTYNGVDISINKDGEYTLKVKGIPTNVKEIRKEISEKALAKPKFDEKKFGATFTFKKDGSIELNDGTEKPQSLAIDKENKKISIKGEKSNITIDNKKNTIDIVADDTSIVLTKGKGVKIKGKKISIGNDSIELLTLLDELITAIGDQQPISPNGPCQPIKTNPLWVTMTMIKTKLGQLKE
jgi:hypothetical protein